MKLLIIGANGMLARDVIEAFQNGNELILCDHPDIDIRRSDSVTAFIERHRPDWVLNCAAYTDVDGAETDRDLAFAVNADGPGILARACREQSARLCHISTDFVFDGSAREPYRETDPVGPLSVYGQSKLAGEHQIQEAFEDYLIVRTSWMFGLGGKNFITTICRLASERDEVQVVDDQIGCPTSAADLAAILRVALEKNLRGIYHACNTGVCSWFELAREAVALSGISSRVVPVATSQMPRPARRPAFSAMDCSKISRDCGLRIRHWREALRDYIAQI
jgi:dTDP-4-dehydrorhamnose reductase